MKEEQNNVADPKLISKRLRDSKKTSKDETVVLNEQLES